MSFFASSPRTRFNLAGVSILLVESSQYGMGLLSQIVTGFGANDVRRARDATQALDQLKGGMLDLIIADTHLSGMDGYDFVRTIRRQQRNPNCFAPVILISGHTPQETVRKARDCGANFIVAKPLTPSVLLQRILWVSQDRRPYVETETFIGPDRRVLELGPPMGVSERRADVLAELAEQMEGMAEEWESESVA